MHFLYFTSDVKWLMSTGLLSCEVVMRLFVSYRSLDRTLVSELVKDLTDMEHETWFDQELEGGQKWWDNILENIRRSDALIFALTPKSIDSVPCQLEYTYANELHKQIIPVMLAEGINYHLLPVLLQERQIVNYVQRDKDSYKNLQGALRSLPPTPPLPDPLPNPPPLPISPLASLKAEIDSTTLTPSQQVELIYKLKGFLHHPEYSRDARELLVRFSQHPALLASSFREIQELLAQPITLSAPHTPTPAATTAPIPESQPKDTPQVVTAASQPLELLPDEVIVREFNDIVLRNYVRLTYAQGKLIVTNQRIIFRAGMLALGANTVEIALSDITRIGRGSLISGRGFQIFTNAGKDYFFSVASMGGLTFWGNIDEVVNTIKSQMPPA